jgi:hypothetical protein
MGDRNSQKDFAMALHDHAIKATVGLILLAGAIGGAATSARVDQHPVSIASAERPPAGRPAVQILRVSGGGGFSWEDAGIGAAGGLGLSMLGVAGGVAVARRRDRRATGSAVAPS